MAESNDQELSTDQKIRRLATRTILRWLVALSSIAMIGAWGATGVYYINPGEAAVVLWLGRYQETITTQGARWRLPAPLGTVETVNVVEIRRLEFGKIDMGVRLTEDFAKKKSLKDEEDLAEPAPRAKAPAISENAIQTADSNIVVPSYVVQYRVKDPFTYLYGLQNPEQTLHDATQAAVREVIGQHEVDQVLSANRAEIEVKAKQALEEILLRYVDGDAARAPFDIREIQLQNVQPPPEVQGAFDDVVSAQQDEVRAASVAQGDAQEITEKAAAKGIEAVSSARAYKETRVIQAEGEAARFEALLAEYRLARRVTRQRLYLEAMEEVMPGIEKIVIDEQAARLLPLLSLPRTSAEAQP